MVDISHGGKWFKGAIIMWHGLVADIPNGWAFCNGSNGTPDLRDRVVPCGNGDSGGVVKTQFNGVTMLQSGGSATSSAGGGATIDNYDLGFDEEAIASSHTHNVANPFYTLAFIMKL